MINPSEAVALFQSTRFEHFNRTQAARQQLALQQQEQTDDLPLQKAVAARAQAAVQERPVVVPPSTGKPPLPPALARLLARPPARAAVEERREAQPVAGQVQNTAGGGQDVVGRLVDLLA